MSWHLPKLNIKQWLNNATERLASTDFITNSRLEAELLLGLATNLDRLQLQLRFEQELTDAELKTAERLLTQRLNNYPFAYLAGKQEFYGRDFIVNEDVLIPRPESETMIEEALNAINNNPIDFHKPIRILDLGCGSGALGTSLAKELETRHLSYQLTLSDISAAALSVAQQNSRLHNVEAKLVESNLLTNIHSSFDIVLANLPYVNPNWNFIRNIDFEPDLALYANDNGLDIIKQFIDQLFLLNNFFIQSWVFLESDPCQQTEIKHYLQQKKAGQVSFKNYITIFKTLG